MVQEARPLKTRVPVLAKYEVKEEIGHGGMATVYRAHDPRLARDVAIKVIHPHLRDSPEVAHRFFVEAKAVAKLRHPNIVEVFDVSAPEETEHYLVVELVRGDTLRKALQRGRPMPPEVAAAFGIELLGALAHAHGCGVVHRDIKPENVMIEHIRSATSDVTGHSTPPPTSKPRATPADSIGDRLKIKLTDFGIAKLLDAQGVTSTGQVLGSPAHMAPEQIEGNDVDARADVFSMGVLIYECMVGHLPFEGSNPAQVLRRVLEGIYPPAERERPEVGKIWSQILDRALANKVEDRFPDAIAMKEAFCAELKRLGVTSPRGELEAWFDDPEGFAARHAKVTITRLCELADVARKEGNAVAAAADYNRALAYAPEDRELLRIVTNMHRADGRRRMVKRVAPPILGAVALGALAFTVTRYAHKPIVDTSLGGPLPIPSLVPVGLEGVDIGARETSTASTASAAPSASIPVVLMPIPKPLPSRANVKRTVTIGTLRPEFGVQIAVDGAPAADAQRGFHVTFDGDKHVLTFTCKADACAPYEKVFGIGEKDETIDVAMRILPATLTIKNADSGSSYRIVEEPTIAISAGVPATIPMDSARRVVHVVEYPSQRTATGRLQAGKEASADMAAPN